MELNRVEKVIVGSALVVAGWVTYMNGLQIAVNGIFDLD